MSCARAPVTMRSSTYTPTMRSSFPRCRVYRACSVAQCANPSSPKVTSSLVFHALGACLEGFAQSEHLVLCPLLGETKCLFDKDSLHELAIEESRLHIEVVNAPVLCYRQC